MKPIQIDADAKALVAASERMTKIMGYAAEAEAFRTLCMLLRETETLQRESERLRKSKAKISGINIVAIDAQIAEIRLLIMGIIDRHMPR